jgi:hypothetical protein
MSFRLGGRARSVPPSPATPSGPGNRVEPLLSHPRRPFPAPQFTAHPKISINQEATRCRTR